MRHLLTNLAMAIWLVSGGAFVTNAADAVTADTSGNSLLNGKYWVRQVVYRLNGSGPKIGQTEAAQSVLGSMTFDGNGGYSFAGQVLDMRSGTSTPYTKASAYRIGGNGIGSIDSVLFPTEFQEDAIRGAVGGNGIFVGSATETIRNDLFVAIPAGVNAATNAGLAGNFWIGHVNYVQGNVSDARNSMFLLNANGQGGFSTVNVTGRARGSTIRNSGVPISQTVAGATYSFSPEGAGSLVFPEPPGVSGGAALFSGTKTLYLSADGNYLLGGDPNGYDIYFGMRPLVGQGADPVAAFKGVYYWASVDADFSDPAALYFGSLSGSINAFGNRVTFWHQRQSLFNLPPIDFTYDGEGTAPAADGTSSSALYRTAVGASGTTAMLVGNGTDYSLTVAVKAPTVNPSEVFLNPFGIFNAASYSPITNPIAPGELITLFGTNIAGTTAVASALPFPTDLGGVQVIINGRPSPVYAVSPTQISAIVPYATSGAYAKVQVINNGKASNAVTMYQSTCAPGIFAVPAVGNGYGAVLHANFQLVSKANPAKQGEVILIYLTGLGAVKPAVPDGSAGPTSPLSVTDNNWRVSFGGSFVRALYNGLAPGAAGLYQINVKIPDDAPVGDAFLDLRGDSCEASQVTIPIVAK